MLVKIIDRNKEEVLMVSSREVAEDFEKRHDHVLEAIEELQKGLPENSGDHLFIATSYIHPQNKQEYKEYLLTRDGFSLLVMGFTGQKALEWKLKYIAAFNEMEKELRRLYEERKKWEIERAKGVLIRHVLTDTIKLKIADSTSKRFAYPNYTKLIYKTIFGKTMDELRKQYNIKTKETIRDYVTAEELKEIESVEMLVSSLINVGMGYDEIKRFIESKYTSSLKIA